LGKSLHGRAYRTKLFTELLLQVSPKEPRRSDDDTRHAAPRYRCPCRRRGGRSKRPLTATAPTAREATDDSPWAHAWASSCRRACSSAKAEAASGAKVIATVPRAPS